MFTEKPSARPEIFIKYCFKKKTIKITSESAEQLHHKMDRRKKRTSTNQYQMYIEMMEKDPIFATGRVPREYDGNYLQKRWKELSDKLNTCNSGPKLTSEEWRKRLNDWKNTTRCKYRRSISGEKDISLTALELRALELFGKNANPSAETVSIHLKSEKEDPDEGNEEHQLTSESFQKELQAAVEEAIGDEDDEMTEEQEDDVLSDPLSNNPNATVANSGNGAGYRTIVVENTKYEDDNNDQMEFITQRRHTLVPSTSGAITVAAGVQTMQSIAAPQPTNTVTKLINGEIPLKRLRTHAPEQVIYEVKKAPITQQRNITIHNSAAPGNSHTILAHPQEVVNSHPLLNTAASSQDAREIARQLKRLADTKAEKLRFEIAKFKFNNPGFHYDFLTL